MNSESPSRLRYNEGKTTNVVIAVSGVRSGIVEEAVRRAVENLKQQLRNPPGFDVVTIENEQQRSEWIGQLPPGFGVRQIALSLSVSAYERALRQSIPTQHEQNPAVGIAICAESNRSECLYFIALHTANQTEFIEFSPKNQADKFGMFLEHLLSNQLLASSTVGIEREQFSSLVNYATENAHELLVDVWHRRRSHVWSAENGTWKIGANLQPLGILSGAFHPLHAGHVAMRDAAEQWLGGSVHYELPIVNAAKPALEYISIAERCRQFDDQNIAVSNAATFAEKADCFPNTTFVVGLDTALRIVDPRFYGNDFAKMEQALSRIQQAECCFLVAGRKISKTFQTVHEINIPSRFLKLFLELPEAAFRADISSSAERQRVRQRDETAENNFD